MWASAVSDWTGFSRGVSGWSRQGHPMNEQKPLHIGIFAALGNIFGSENEEQQKSVWELCHEHHRTAGSMGKCSAHLMWIKEVTWRDLKSSYVISHIILYWTSAWSHGAWQSLQNGNRIECFRRSRRVGIEEWVTVAEGAWGLRMGRGEGREGAEEQRGDGSKENVRRYPTRWAFKTRPMTQQHWCHN